ncbi:MAG: restriction endonuclease subunit S [Candidatus Brocadia sp.]|nr:hypothetical protein [Candidatus Brocadia fulgida]MDG5995459.1 restriction endonuclease subunit S [Candidatus Brocadia sp.]
MSNGKLKMDNCQLPTVNSKFKRTEVGGIPNDWEVKRIDECSKICVGRDLIEAHYSPIQDHKYRYPIYSNTVDNRGLYGYYDIEEYKGESLTVVGRGVGLGTAFKRDGGYGAIGRLLILFPLEKYDASFLTEYINHRVKIFEESSGIPQLTSVSLSKYKIPLPPTKAEQTTIAAALSDADALITQLEKLIAKKRNIKRGAMHELLTGQKRLPGFSGKWEVMELGEVLKVRHGKSQKEIIDENGEFPILATSGVVGRTSTFIYNKPSVLIGRKGTIDVPQYMDTPFWAIDTIFYTEIFENAFPKFIFYKFNLIDWYSHNEASGVPSLNAKTIEKIEMLFPQTKEEQTTIARILSDMDAEIEALEKKLEKYKMIKQGMMQNLLTGKIRLV